MLSREGDRSRGSRGLPMTGITPCMSPVITRVSAAATSFLANSDRIAPCLARFYWHIRSEAVPTGVRCLAHIVPARANQAYSQTMLYPTCLAVLLVDRTPMYCASVVTRVTGSDRSSVVAPFPGAPPERVDITCKRSFSPISVRRL